MFEDSIVTIPRRNKKVVAASVFFHVLVLAILLVLPFHYTEKLSASELEAKLYAPSPPASKPKEPVDVNVDRPKPRVEKEIKPAPGDIIAPTEIPKEIPVFDDLPVTEISRPVPKDTGGCLLCGVRPTNNQPEAAPLPPPPPPPPPAPPERVRVGGNVQAANLIHQVKPEYPPLAKQARIQGVVVMEAEINEEGMIDNLRVITGHPLLINAAIAAVKQWVYKPTLLNGMPVRVVTTITVNFAFAQ